MAKLRILVTLMLIIAIAIIFSFIIAIAIVKFSADSSLGKSIRNYLIRYPFIVNLAGLNRPGDAVYTLIDSESGLLSVSIYSSREKAPDPKITGWLEEMIATTVGNAAVIEQRELFSLQPSYTTDDLNDLLEELDSNDSADVKLIYLTEYADKPTNVGLTISKDAIFIFRNTLDNLSANSVRTERLEQSTLMHEWGHLLNLPHTDNPGCIMSEHVEVDDGNMLNGREIETKYCPETLMAIDALFN